MAQQFKVFTAGMMHESHSFCPIKADLERFKSTGGYKRDNEISAAYLGTRSEMGAVLEMARKRDWKLLHPLFAYTTPCGPVTKEAFEHFSDEITVSLTANLPFDGIILVLHGAMVVDEVDDAEAELLARVRAIVGASVPIAITLDLHANVGPRTAEFANIACTYKTTPHVDQFEIAWHAADLLHAAMAGEIDPVLTYAQRPTFDALDQGRTISGKGPMIDVLRRADERLASEPEIYAIGVQAGFDWSDKVHLGPSILITAERGADSARYVADELADMSWDSRGIKTIEMLSLPEAMRIAAEPAQQPGPLLIGDYTDCPGGAGMGDGTALLAAMIDAKLDDAVLCSIADPEAVTKCFEAGVGAQLTLSLGGKLLPGFGGEALVVDGEVLALSNGVAIRKGPYFTGVATSFGPSCLVKVGNIKVIVATHRRQIDDREQFRIFGIEPESANILACKAMNHFRADFEKIGRRLIYVDSDGIVSWNWKRFDYKHVRRPVWPLDD